MYEMAKSAREKMKAKARSLAAPGTLVGDQKVDSSDWTAPAAINADAKTGMRPISKRAYKDGGKVSGSAAPARADRKARKSGGRVETEIGVGMANKDMKEANEKREGVKHVGALKRGGKARATGGSVPSDVETQTNKARIGNEKIKPVRGAAGHYKKGGGVKKAGGGGSWLEKVVGKPKSTSDISQVGKGQTSSYTQEERGALNKAIEDNDALPAPGEAMERSGKFQDYKKGGRAKRATGGRDPSYVGSESVTYKGRPVTRPSDIEDRKQREPEASDLYSSDQMRRLERGYKKGGNAKRAAGGRMPLSGHDFHKKTDAELRYIIKDAGEAARNMKGMNDKAEGKYLDQVNDASTVLNYRKQGGERIARATGGGLISSLKSGKKSSKRGGKTDIHITINAGGKPSPRHLAAPMSPLPGADAAPPMPPVPPMPPGPPMGAGPMPGGPGGPGAPPPALLGRKAGGRISKVASSYKDMEAGAGSGEGRLQKTDIAKKGGDAPARKEGGRISKVAKSYKDMTAGAGNGEGRLQKTDIAKAKAGRGK